jgi:hypothetical protein
MDRPWVKDRQLPLALLAAAEAKVFVIVARRVRQSHKVFSGCGSSLTCLARWVTSNHDCCGEGSHAMASRETSRYSQLPDSDLDQDLKRPKRITITVNHSLYTKLVERSSSEGRSISNLASYLLERELEGTP